VVIFILSFPSVSRKSEQKNESASISVILFPAYPGPFEYAFNDVTSVMLWSFPPDVQQPHHHVIFITAPMPTTMPWCTISGNSGFLLWHTSDANISNDNTTSALLPL
jgi:hypothetical protein